MQFERFRSNCVIMNTFINITFLIRNEMECLIIIVQQCIVLNKQFRTEFLGVFWNWNTQFQNHGQLTYLSGAAFK